MTRSTLRLSLALLALGLFSAEAHAQSDRGGPYGLQNTTIEITPRGWSWGDTHWVRGETKPMTLSLTPDGPIEGDAILLTFSDGRSDHPVRLRRSRDGSFVATADLPSPMNIRALRIGTGEERGRNVFQMPQIRETRDGHFTGRREAQGWDITIYVGDDGVEIEINW